MLCNRVIKFGAFRRYAKRLGADGLATGHYARIGSEGGRPVLCKAQDAAKDQTYFLHAVTADALAETIFPLGALAKHDVRALARDRGLPVFDKKDSTGICFIGERPFREFLARHLTAGPGPIRTPEGEVLGEHAGLPYYTIGQRQGLRVGGRAGKDDAPWYVAAKDAATNALVVVQGDHPLLYSGELTAVDASWIGAVPDAFARGEVLACQAKIRYRQPDQACRVRRTADGLSVRFAEPQRAVTPGQFVVFYDGERCLGGAVIASAGAAARAPGALRAAG